MKTWQSWLPGSSNIFLNDLEHRFNEEMIADLRGIGVRVPLVTTNTWGGNPLASLPALTDSDIIDVHAYGTELELEKNPAFSPSITTRLAASQVAGMPMSVSEWNVSPFPARDRHVLPLLIASNASHQGWDALMQYAYAKNSLDKIGKPSNWHSHNDPAFLATLPAAALLYRRDDVMEASAIYYLSPGEALFYENISHLTSPAIRTASKRSKLVMGMPKTRKLPWLEPSSPPADAIIVEDYKKSFIGPNSPSTTSDTGEIFHDWEQGIYTVNTARSQVAIGWLGGKTLELGDTTYEFTTPNVSAAVQSLDDDRIRESNDILVSLTSTSVLSRGPKGQQKLPFLSQLVKGRILIRSTEGKSLYRVDATGGRNRFDANYQDGVYIIDLNNMPLTHWLILTSN